MSNKALWTKMPQYTTKAKVKKPRYIKARTPKRAKEEREYSKQVKVWKRNQANRFCLGCRPIFKLGFPNDTDDCHHFAGRRGALLLYQPFWIPLCQKCHDWVGKNISKAIEMNLRAPNHEYNQMPKPQPTTT